MIKTKPRSFLFDTVKMTAPERNGFDLSHENKQTCKAGYLYPFEVLEALPNDDFQIQVEQFVRLQPMLSPTMHRLKSYWHWFFCPNRLTWNYWEEFISRGNGKKLSDDGDYVPPEPVTITLYDMLYAFNWRDFSDADVLNLRLLEYYKDLGYNDLTYFGTLSEDEQTEVLQNVYPEFIVKRCKQIGTIGARWVFFNSTPRLATSMGIVDTCIPRGVVDFDWHNNLLVPVNGDFGLDVNNTFSYSPQMAAYIGKNALNPDDTSVMPVAETLIPRLQSIKLSVMPFVAYALIYNEYYRDENLIQEVDEMLNFFREETGALDMTDFMTLSYTRDLLNIYYRAWEKDYFTTATRLPQKAPDVVIPGGDITSDGAFELNRSDISLDSRTTHQLFIGSSDGYLSRSAATNNSGSTYALVYGKGLKTGTTTVADIRRSFALQRWFEKAVRCGTRYIETLKAFFNSDAGDARLQRPEFFGGTSEPIQISDVVQNSATADGSDTPQGNLAGYGISAGNSELISYHAPEHGFVFGIFSILARTSYGQGIPKMFSRETWLDYAFPEFEHIGEQGVQNKELFAAPLTKDLLNDKYTVALPNDANQIFGYQSRYSEYKQIPDRFGGAFARSLDFWSLGRMFDNAPTLSQQFVEANISQRNFAVGRIEDESDTVNLKTDVEDVDTDQYICDFWMDIKKVTSLTLYSEPI